MSILVFIGFLVLYAAWIWAAKVMSMQNSRAILENSQKIVRRRTYQVDVYRPDLSRPPAQ